jgi:hypothetical protein
MVYYCVYEFPPSTSSLSTLLATLLLSKLSTYILQKVITFGHNNVTCDFLYPKLHSQVNYVLYGFAFH